MIDVGLLYFLAVIDGMFVGYRDAIGRNPRLDKRAFFLRAMLTGIGLAHLAMLLIAITVGITLLAAPDPALTVASLHEVTAVMRPVYLGFAGCVAVSLSFYAIPSYDLQSYLTVTTLASLTLVRPLVILGGAAVAAVHVGAPLVWATCAVVGITMAGLQPLIHRLGWNHYDWSNLMAGPSPK